MPLAEAQLSLAEDVASFVHDPLGFNRYAYEDPLRQWQVEEFAALGEHLRNPATRFQPYLLSIASGHGPGKSAYAGRLLNWGMSTFEGTRATITAGTGKQLATKTWPEIDKWFKRSITSDWFDVKAESITFKTERWKNQWRADRVTWSDVDPQSFAGMHNLHRRIIVLFDEASTIAKEVYLVTQGALTDERTEIIWVLLGQPEKTDGYFFDTFHRLRHRWRVRQIDARTVEGTNKEYFKQLVEDNGEDSDIVRVRVKGEFPRASSNQLIPADLVSAARRRVLDEKVILGMPLILTLDVARFGDDENVCLARQGRKAWVVDHWRGLDTVVTAERFITHKTRLKPQASVIDGDGVGGGVVDQVRHRGHIVVEFHGGAAPLDERFLNRRAEVWSMTGEWFKGEPQISDDPQLETDLTTPLYFMTTRTNKIQLESKDDMKERGFSSPDRGDALAMSFAAQIAPPRPKVRPPVRVTPWN